MADQRVNPKNTAAKARALRRFSRLWDSYARLGATGCFSVKAHFFNGTCQGVDRKKKITEKTR